MWNAPRRQWGDYELSPPCSVAIKVGPRKWAWRESLTESLRVEKDRERCDRRLFNLTQSPSSAWGKGRRHLIELHLRRALSERLGVVERSTLDKTHVQMPKGGCGLL